jgi:hypothetical protein
MGARHDLAFQLDELRARLAKLERHPNPDVRVEASRLIDQIQADITRHTETADQLLNRGW